MGKRGKNKSKSHGKTKGPKPVRKPVIDSEPDLDPVDAGAVSGHLKIAAEIDKKWRERFPLVSEEERYTTDKDEIIQLYVDRLAFVSDLTPHITSARMITQDDITRSQMLCHLRMEIVKDIDRSPHREDIRKACEASMRERNNVAS